MSIRLSDDLPEGEGTAFVTAVPGAKFHVLGRRDPKTGELCAGTFCRRSTPLPELAPPFLEYVTGPEAEHFLPEVAKLLGDDRVKSFDDVEPPTIRIIKLYGLRGMICEGRA